MKALTIHQPWAWLIMAGHKRVENRPAGTDYRGPLAIHAGARAGAERQGWLDAIPSLRAWGYPIPDVEDLEFGAILGTVELIDVVRYDPSQPALPGIIDQNALAADEFVSGPVCWVLRDPKPLEKPVAYRGQQGLWEWEQEG